LHRGDRHVWPRDAVVDKENETRLPGGKFHRDRMGFRLRSSSAEAWLDAALRVGQSPATALQRDVPRDGLHPEVVELDSLHADSVAPATMDIAALPLHCLGRGARENIGGEPGYET
jgi:hypothetical protein